MVRFLANENIPRSLVAHLRTLGVEVVTVVEIGFQGASDETVLQAAVERGLSILTQDLDFGRIFVEREPAAQIVVLRSRDPRPESLARIVDTLLIRVDLASPEFAQALFVVGENGYRVRKRAL